MSFTSNVKNEVSKQQMDKIASITLLSAIIKNSATIDNNIKVSTENPSVARLIFNIVKELYVLEFLSDCHLKLRKQLAIYSIQTFLLCILK